ncbi:hypothetical protein F5Y15DRAFT_412470 [Xylariaceae sp. FL0016]|nr:hypothetical protein F5Y15DRAFT_412470 [Xylariaceae sp. FL0016]
MDPLSATASAIALASECRRAFCETRRIFRRLKAARQTIYNLDHEVKLMTLSLEEMQRSIQRHVNVLSGSDRKSICDAVDDCRRLLVEVRERLERVQRREGFWVNVAMLWREQDFDDLLRQVDRKKGLLKVLIDGLNMNSMATMVSLVRDSVKDMKASSRKSGDRSPRSESESTSASEASMTEFSFDSELLQSRAYRFSLTAGRRSQRLRGVSIEPEEEADPELPPLLPWQPVTEDDVPISSDTLVPDMEYRHPPSTKRSQLDLWSNPESSSDSPPVAKSIDGLGQSYTASYPKLLTKRGALDLCEPPSMVRIYEDTRLVEASADDNTELISPSLQDMSLLTLEDSGNSRNVPENAAPVSKEARDRRLEVHRYRRLARRKRLQGGGHE